MKQTIQVLNKMVEDGVVGDYAIGGAIALSFYTEPHATLDMDVYVLFPESDGPLISLGPIYEYLRERGHEPKGEHVSIHGVLVQLLPTDELTDDALSNAENMEFFGEPTKVLSREHLAAIMVKVNRSKDRVRLPFLLELDEFDMEKFESLIVRFGMNVSWEKIRRLLDG